MGIDTIIIFILLLFSILLLVFLILSFFVVRQQDTAILERFGKFHKICGAGLNTKIPFIDVVVARLPLRLQQLDLNIETKTEDNVFVKISVAVQYFVKPERVYEAFYRLAYPETQITAFVFDVVRARVPKIKLDDVFERKDEIADAVRIELSQMMDEFGYGIVKALVTDIEPDANVKSSMNEINAAQRMRLAAVERGEAERIMKVKSAEAEAQSKALQGKGIADQRKAIIDGLKDSINEFNHTLPQSSPNEVMNLILLTQYFDTLKEIGHNSKSNTILLPHSPSGLEDIMNQMRAVLLQRPVTND